MKAILKIPVEINMKSCGTVVQSKEVFIIDGMIKDNASNCRIYDEKGNPIGVTQNVNYEFGRTLLTGITLDDLRR